MALARIRQLGAHEVGHTIGLSHNYISSAQTAAGQYSVMDYPHPIIELDDDGNVELRDAYPHGIGDWDKVWIQYGYTDFAPGTDEDEALNALLMDAAEEGLTFISDQDARPAGSAHPNVHLWDNGANAAAELDRMMDVRRVALDQFGESAIKSRMPMATMEEALVPLYLHHRYQAEATTKVVAGQYYTYAMRGDGQEPLRPVPAREQKQAMDALLRTLDPSELTIPRSILEVLPPRPFRYGPHQELFSRQTGLVFDIVAPAAAAAEINRAVERVFVDRLIALAGQAPMPQVRALTSQALMGIRNHVGEASPNGDGADRAHYFLIQQDIERFLNRPYEAVPTPQAPAAPPGSPIGDSGMGWLDWKSFSGSGGGWVNYDW